MAKLLNPVLTNTDPFESTKYRFKSLFLPIQQIKEKNKKSDFLAFVTTPLLDYFVLDTLFVLDTSIRTLNALVSLLKAAYLWTLNQQGSKQIIDSETEKELRDADENLNYILSNLVAQIFNSILSTISLLTRPIASIAKAVADCDTKEQELMYLTP